jgi:hypothetical protein
MLLKSIYFQIDGKRSLKTSLVIILIVYLSLSALAKNKRNTFYITNQVPLLAQPYTALPLALSNRKECS